MDGTTGLLLNGDRAGSDFRSGDDITDPALDQVAAAKLVVYRKVERARSRMRRSRSRKKRRAQICFW
ncbi:hypothetical protein CHELA17_64759 [Chelatococcus asaccharovorans]|nr:hypothetical protein CHELA17_64759 [Chelatococcus asaccharovorans]